MKKYYAVFYNKETKEFNPHLFNHNFTIEEMYLNGGIINMLHKDFVTKGVGATYYNPQSNMPPVVFSMAKFVLTFFSEI